MTPAARVAAAIEVLDLWRAGEPAEKVLTNWARGHRFAGSKDRAAIRDLVYDAVRCQRSYAGLGGADTGRGLMIGALRAAGTDPAEMFSGEGYGPAPLAEGEVPNTQRGDLPEAERLDLPDWICTRLAESLGNDLAPVAEALRHRAPVFLRVNLVKGDLARAQAALADEGIETRPHPLSPTALEVTEGARRVAGSQAFAEGLVELQDAASQAVVDALPITAGTRALDYCAGGGGKSLAMAARGAVVSVHDIDAGRMADLPARAERAGIVVNTLLPKAVTKAGPFDLVLADAPCSGSGAWRRAPQGKWDLTPERLDELCAIQAGILTKIAPLVAPGGRLAYATCSLFEAENGGQIAAFLTRHPEWSCAYERQLTPQDGGDGFYVALLTR